MQGIDDYNIKQKNDWRGWAWNRLVERIPVPVEKARVLYLAGPDDHDRREGLNRGFKNENLIAVDVVEDNVLSVRAAGGYAVQGKLHDVVLSMQPPFLFHGIVADFCSGVSQDVIDFLSAIAIAPAHTRLPTGRNVTGAAIVVNMQRGRDLIRGDVSGWVAEAHDALGGARRDWLRECLDSAVGGSDDISKHRGAQFLLMTDMLAVQFLTETLDAPGPGFHTVWGGEVIKRWSPRQLAAKMRYHASLSLQWNPRLFSYRASRVFMDSVAMRFVFPKVRLSKARRSELANQTIVRRIAALRAIQTRRTEAA